MKFFQNWRKDKITQDGLVKPQHNLATRFKKENIRPEPKLS